MEIIKYKTIVIDDIPRSPNGPRGLFRMTGWSRQKYFAMWRVLVRAEIPFAPAMAPELKALVRIHQVRRALLDPDNLVASCKPILDALEANNLIFKDNSRWIKLEPTQEASRRDPIKTVIEIELIHDKKRTAAQAAGPNI